MFGLSQTAAAFNAALTEHALSLLTAPQVASLVRVLPGAIAAGAPYSMDDDAAISLFNQSGRVQQLNIIAIAMMNYGIKPAELPARWMPMKNPFDPRFDLPKTWENVRLAEYELLKKHGVSVHVPGARLSFDFADPELPTHPDACLIFSDDSDPDEAESLDLTLEWIHDRFNSGELDELEYEKAKAAAILSEVEQRTRRIVAEELAEVKAMLVLSETFGRRVR